MSLLVRKEGEVIYKQIVTTMYVTIQQEGFFYVDDILYEQDCQIQAVFLHDKKYTLF